MSHHDSPHQTRHHYKNNRPQAMAACKMNPPSPNAGTHLASVKVSELSELCPIFLSEHSQIFLSGPNPIFLSEPSQIFLSKQITIIALPSPSHPPHQCTGCCFYRTQVRSLHWLLLSLIDLLTNSLTAV